MLSAEPAPLRRQGPRSVQCRTTWVSDVRCSSNYNMKLSHNNSRNNTNKSKSKSKSENNRFPSKNSKKWVFWAQDSAQHT